MKGSTRAVWPPNRPTRTAGLAAINPSSSASCRITLKTATMFRTVKPALRSAFESSRTAGI